jgi:outer membrane protein
MRSFVLAVALGLMLIATPALAQTAGQTPAAPAPAPAQPAPTAQPPRPFPEGAKVAFINIQRIAGESAEGKVSTSKVQALNQKKVAELNDINKKIQDAQTKLQTQASVLSEAARAQLEREVEKQQKELQRSQQDAQEEVQNLQADLQTAFQAKLIPVIQQVATEKGLQMLFSQQDSGIVWADGGLDLTAEVIKRFDAATGTAAPTAAPAKPPVK